MTQPPGVPYWSEAGTCLVRPLSTNSTLAHRMQSPNMTAIVRESEQAVITHIE